MTFCAFWPGCALWRDALCGGGSPWSVSNLSALGTAERPQDVQPSLPRCHIPALRAEEGPQLSAGVWESSEGAARSLTPPALGREGMAAWKYPTPALTASHSLRVASTSYSSLLISWSLCMPLASVTLASSSSSPEPVTPGALLSSPDLLPPAAGLCKTGPVALLAPHCMQHIAKRLFPLPAQAWDAGTHARIAFGPQETSPARSVLAPTELSPMCVHGSSSHRAFAFVAPPSPTNMAFRCC